jgi:hypothetical protein
MHPYVVLEVENMITEVNEISFIDSLTIIMADALFISFERK